MPVIKSAIKKLRQDKKREKNNDIFRSALEQAVKKAKKDASKANISSAFSILDKAVKKEILHKNKAARIKSSLVKAPTKPQSTTETKATKKTKPTPAKTKKAKPSAKTAKKK